MAEEKPDDIFDWVLRLDRKVVYMIMAGMVIIAFLIPIEMKPVPTAGSKGVYNAVEAVYDSTLPLKDEVWFYVKNLVGV